MMKIKTRSNFWIYCVCTVSAIIILYALNWVLKLPAITDVIGDENTWLPIVADAIISGVIFIGGNWYANADRLRNDIQHKKSEFQIISECVNRVINSLNISRRQLSILYSIEISMDTPSLIKEVLEIQQEIDEAQQQFARSKYLISDTSKVSAFEDCVKTVSAAYHVVFDTMQKILNDWIATNSASSEARTVADYIGTQKDKSDFAIKYVEHCKKLQSEKKRLIGVYDTQKDRADLLFASVQNSGREILDSEYTLVKQLENKL